MYRPRQIGQTAAGVLLLLLVLAGGPIRAQGLPATPSAAESQEPELDLPADYVIGPEDVLSIVFWRDEDMTTEVVVRPDGRITLPLINDLSAAGLTPEELGARVTEAASRLIESPTVTVSVREVNSRKVFITGEVGAPGSYPLVGPMTVTQLISTANGLSEWAKKGDIRVLRTEEDGRRVAFRVNYDHLEDGRSLDQDILLEPGDTVIVP